MGDARRRSLAGFTTPRSQRPTVAAQPQRVEQRLCLMSHAGRCKLSFHALGDEDRFMCSEHWRHVPEEMRQQLAAEFEAIKKAHALWQQAQRTAVLTVLRATGQSID